VLIESQVALGEFLCTQLAMDRVMFGNSGTEVTEGAIKLARLWSREKFKRESKHKIMVFKGSFHGRTYGAMSATWSPKVREGFDPFLPGYVFAEFNNLADVDAKWDDDICAVMLETVQGDGGVMPATPEFLRALRQRCTERGAAFVCDEVQCGMGRTGKKMAYMHAGVDPDIVPLAKALGGGFPIGALLARGEFAEVFTKGRHGTTFGGNPLACAAALAAARVLFDESLLKEVTRKGEKLRAALEKMKTEFPAVCESVRGLGLMAGLVMKKDAMSLIGLARKQGLILNVTASTVVRLLPPLVITDAEIEDGIARMRAALAEFSKG
jgi:acetylornithine/succinyldiaminopimelate/putrescine aminotransferase